MGGTRPEEVWSEQARRVVEQFERWRAGKQGHERIPARLWEAAAALCATSVEGGKRGEAVREARRRPRGGTACLLAAARRDFPSRNYLNPKAQRDILHKLSRIIGQTRGLQRALERRKTCEDLLIQASAIRSAMGQVMARLLENHMETCVIDDLRRGSAPQAVARLRNALAVVLRRT